MHYAGTQGRQEGRGVWCLALTCANPQGAAHMIASRRSAVDDNYVRPHPARPSDRQLAIPSPGVDTKSGTSPRAPFGTATTTSSTAPRPTSHSGVRAPKSSPTSRPAALGAEGVSLIVVDQGHTGLRSHRKLDRWVALIGYRRLSYTDVRVPRGQLLGSDHLGFRESGGLRLRTRRPGRQETRDAQRCST